MSKKTKQAIITPGAVSGLERCRRFLAEKNTRFIISIIVFFLLPLTCAVTFKIVTAQKLSLEGYGFKIHMEGSQK
jgi:hypothetical protein